MHPTLQRLLHSERAAPVVLDGAWGTRLQARGLLPGACPDAWNLSHPDQVQAVALAYVDAGSQVILTNTFGANPLRLERHGLAGKCSDINREGASISREAAGDRALVFGSIGPTGAILMMEEVPAADVLRAFREQAAALAQGGVDGLIVETMAELDEALLALCAARETGLPVAVSMTFDERGRTMMGVEAREAAEALADAGADSIGTNCGLGPGAMLDLCRTLSSATDLPLWVKPNAGLPELVGTQTVYRTTPDEFAIGMALLVEVGAAFVGGCCGTGPEYIRAARRHLGSPS